MDTSYTYESDSLSECDVNNNLLIPADLRKQIYNYLEIVSSVHAAIFHDMPSATASKKLWDKKQKLILSELKKNNINIQEIDSIYLSLCNSHNWYCLSFDADKYYITTNTDAGTRIINIGDIPELDKAMEEARNGKRDINKERAILNLSDDYLCFLESDYFILTDIHNLCKEHTDISIVRKEPVVYYLMVDEITNNMQKIEHKNNKDYEILTGSGTEHDKYKITYKMIDERKPNDAPLELTQLHFMCLHFVFSVLKNDWNEFSITELHRYVVNDQSARPPIKEKKEQYEKILDDLINTKISINFTNHHTHPKMTIGNKSQPIYAVVREPLLNLHRAIVDKNGSKVLCYYFQESPFTQATQSSPTLQYANESNMYEKLPVLKRSNNTKDKKNKANSTTKKAKITEYITKNVIINQRNKLTKWSVNFDTIASKTGEKIVTESQPMRTVQLFDKILNQLIESNVINAYEYKYTGRKRTGIIVYFDAKK